MIVDIGGGTTEVAVISLSGIVHSTSLRLGGDDMNDAIALHIREESRPPDRGATGRRDQDPARLADPQPESDVAPMPVKGRDLTSGLPEASVRWPRCARRFGSP